jgi:hypothetical protein
VTDQLAQRAQELLDAMREAIAGGGSIETWIAFETPEGGLTLVEGCTDPPESFRWSHGARRVWRVRRMGARLVAEGFAGDACCRLEAPSPKTEAVRMLERAGVDRVLWI